MESLDEGLDLAGTSAIRPERPNELKREMMERRRTRQSQKISSMQAWPSTSRPSFHPDREELEIQLGQLKKDNIALLKEVNAAKIATRVVEEKLQSRERDIYDLLHNRPMTDKHVKEMMATSSEQVIAQLKKQLDDTSAALSLARNSLLESNLGGIGHSMAAPPPSVKEVTTTSSFLDWDAASTTSSIPPTPSQRMMSGSSVTGGVGSGGGVPATPASRRSLREESKKQHKEIEKLQELLRATEIVADANERRVRELERELSTIREKSLVRTPLESVVANAVAEAKFTQERELREKKEKSLFSLPLYTEDSAAFDKYLQTLVEEERSKLGMKDKTKAVTSTDTMGQAQTLTTAQNAVPSWMYKVIVWTGTRQRGPTSCKCFISIKGSEGETPQLELKKSSFAPGSMEGAIVYCKDIGELMGVRIGHDNAGTNAHWHIDSVCVMVPFGPSYTFGVDLVLPDEEVYNRCFADLTDYTKKDTTQMVKQPVQRSKPIPSQIPKRFLDVVKYIHEEPSHGLYCLGHLSNLKLNIPKSAKKLQVLLLGSTGGPQRFIEHLVGSRIQNAGIGTETLFTIVTAANTPGVVKGEEALEAFPGSANLKGMRGVSTCFCKESLQSKFLSTVDIIVGPQIEGTVGKGLSAQQEMLQKVRKEITSNATNLRERFRASDIDGDGQISRNEFLVAIKSLNVSLRDSEINDLFTMLDATGDGNLEYDEFLNAFRTKNIEYPYDLETAISHVAAEVDLIFCFMDPKISRFNLRELQILRNIRYRFKNKSHLVFFLKGQDISQQNITDYVKVSATYVAAEFHEAALQKTPCCFIPSDVDATKLAVVENHLPQMSKLVREMDTAKVVGCIADVEFNLTLIANRTVEKQKQHLNPPKGQEEAYKQIRKDADALKTRVIDAFKMWSNVIGKSDEGSIRKLKLSFDAGLRIMRDGHSATSAAAGASENNVKMWTGDQVIVWFQKLGMGQYADVLNTRGINGRALIELCVGNGEGLRELLGISLGHRKEILKKMQTMANLKQ